MKKNHHKKKMIILLLVLSIVLIGFSKNIKNAHAQIDYRDNSLNVPSIISVYEFSEEFGNQNNKTSIDINALSMEWNLTEIQANFTDIEFNREIVEIETDSTGSYSLGYFFFEALAVQINITDPTTLYGVEIYGSSKNPPIEEAVYIEIRGYNSTNNSPNKTIYLQQNITMSNLGEWYLQKFEKPLELKEGNYTLVINATKIMKPYPQTYQNIEYKWHYNDIEPKNPDLYVSYYDKQEKKWSSGIQNQPFLYKLDQKLNYSFLPEDVNMTAEISGERFSVLNDDINGNLTVTNVNLASNSQQIFHIPIHNNKSSSLLFNISYRITIKNEFAANTTLLISEGTDNFWTITPNITRTSSNNYYIKIITPNNWYNLTIFKNKVNITGEEDVIIEENILNILNYTITDDAKWEITAYSNKIIFEASIPKSEYLSLQTVEYTVQPPSINGNITFIQLDPIGKVMSEETRTILFDVITFSYILPIEPLTGTWKAYMFWNNNTDAGLVPLNFYVIESNGNDSEKNDMTIITGLDPQFIFIVVSIIIAIFILGLSSYQLIKRYKKAQAEHRQRIYNKYMDLLNLDYIIITEKDSGVNIYEQVIAGKKKDITLIAGFLQAIRSFGIELSDSKKQSQTIKLEYHDSKILMSEFRDFRIINIMKENPSQVFFDSLKPLSYDIDKYYGKSIKNFDGEISQFEGIKRLIEDHLQISLIYPLKIVNTKEIKLSSSEKAIVNKVSKLMKERGINHFYVSNLMKEKEFNVRIAQIILDLIKKKVFQAYN